MSESKDYHAPIDGSSTKTPLVNNAVGAFKVMLWVGLIALVGWVIAGGVGFSTDSYYEPERVVGAFAFAGLCLQIAIPFLVGAGIVAGLGKREDAAVKVKGVAGSYAPVDES